MTGHWPEAVERVAGFLRAAGVEARIEEFPDGTATAAASAEAAGCRLDRIVKSLVCICDERPVLAMVPGDRRADPRKVAAAVGATKARIARADEVIAATGFEPGAVAPFPLSRIARVLIDRSLLRHAQVWIGAGSPRHLALLTPVDLARISRAEAFDLSEG